MKVKNTIAITLVLTAFALSSCSSMRTVLSVDSGQTNVKPISNPFIGYRPEANPGETMILRTKRGDGTVEVEIPRANQDLSDFVIPITAATAPAAGGRAPASVATNETASGTEGLGEDPYKDHEASLSDREILKTLPQNLPEDEAKRREIEQELGLVRADDVNADDRKSYLAKIDRVKQLYRSGRYEAALLETDGMLRLYPTHPQLHEMRGTLLDRIGQTELALNSWKQALRFDPKNESLRRFIERKEQRRSLASP